MLCATVSVAIDGRVWQGQMGSVARRIMRSRSNACKVFTVQHKCVGALFSSGYFEILDILYSKAVRNADALVSSLYAAHQLYKSASAYDTDLCAA